MSTARNMQMQPGRRIRHGTIFVVTMWIVLALAGMVLVLARSMRVEATASANQVAAIQAAAVERGAEQYIIGLIDQQSTRKDSILTLGEEYFSAIAVGDGYFWIHRPARGEQAEGYGLIDEASKLNLNAEAVDLSRLPLPMTADIVDAINEWKSVNQTPLESVEDVLLVDGATPQLLYGTQQNINTSISLSSTDLSEEGLFNYLTVKSRRRNNQGQVITGQVNVLTAPEAVLKCINGLNDTDVAGILSARGTAQYPDNEMAVRAIMQPKPQPVRRRLAYESLQFSADIVAVSADGRAFRYCRIIVDAMQSPPRIIYRRDMTGRGWPLDRQILTSLQDGQAPAVSQSTSGGQL